ncbi:CocE/NonD family hydrolase [Fibrella aquatilis]|uniref:CocE/NonD family hydrolase n=1 Tax=Fibrella aquatilis TaxID=2817059 RepID=A0A939G756_9BACT|nr:CocE/NonD family hydrolase [Fibrella aquatilis]MBO0931397.1 CocE/NonD family hydrolase [Fibrella aquatilis]
MLLRFLLTLLISTTVLLPALAQSPTDSAFVRANYVKLDRQITMRDGVKLYTLIYVPKDAATTKPYPFLMQRTPYSAGPYGETTYPKRGPGPSAELSREKYIFVYQDVRGRYMSEGNFEEMTPHISGIIRSDKGLSKKELRKKYARRNTWNEPTDSSKTSGWIRNLSPVGPIDESTDTYDTVEWLLKNVPNNNGRVGITGISYPGFYASAALPNAHPAIKAVSPQAPVTDEFAGDDARHNGAFFLLDNFSFMNEFDAPRKGPVADYPELFAFNPADVYAFFLKLGPVKNANGPAYYNQQSKIWNEYLTHETYDAYWQARNIRPHLNMVRPGSTPPATLVVGGWYDAEDLFGALNTYVTLEQRAGNQNQLVMGPWTHGGWARGDFSRFGDFEFGQNTAKTFRDSVETPFFNFYLKDKGTYSPTEARVFDTGTNQWRTFAQWPPQNTTEQPLYLGSNSGLSTSESTTPARFEYVSDPTKPVPYTDGIWPRRNNAYMIEDQRFAARRPDVLVFQTEPLTADITLAGPISVDLRVALSSTDADFIVKLIDVLPDTAANPKPVAGAKPVTMAGYQRLVRADILRGKFRNSFERPEAFVPGQPTPVAFMLNDALHTFRKGHRLMIQVQSSWFPLVDRNPQTFVNISQAGEADFKKATITLLSEPGNASVIRLPLLR